MHHPERPGQPGPGAGAAAVAGASDIGSVAVPGQGPLRVWLAARAASRTPDCELSLPWAGLEAEDLARATARRRWSRAAPTRVSRSRPTPPGHGVTQLSRPRPSSPRATGSPRPGHGSTARSRRCGLGRPGSIAGVSGLVGERHKPTLGPGDAGRFLLTSRAAAPLPRLRGRRVVIHITRGRGAPGHAAAPRRLNGHRRHGTAGTGEAPTTRS